MKYHKSAKKTKGMVFAGCSFTWGQGLYYYSNLKSLIEPTPNIYDHNLINDSHIEYMKSRRFARLVADNFKSFEICQPWNGGASYSIHDWWNKSFRSRSSYNRSNNSDNKWPTPCYDIKDINCIIYQCTQWHRAQSNYCPNNDPISHFTAMYNSDGFQHWLENNNLTIDSYQEHAIKKEIQDVKKFLKNFVDAEVQVYVLSWPRDYNKIVLDDDWFTNKFIKLSYKNKSYLSIEDMTEDHDELGNILNPELVIARDYEHFKIPPKDYHPSEICHRVIAESIIKHLDKVKQ